MRGASGLYVDAFFVDAFFCGAFFVDFVVVCFFGAFFVDFVDVCFGGAFFVDFDDAFFDVAGVICAVVAFGAVVEERLRFTGKARKCNRMRSSNGRTSTDRAEARATSTAG